MLEGDEQIDWAAGYSALEVIDQYARRQGVSGQWLLDYQRFLAQLETAVEQQNRSLAWHQDVVEKARVAWSEKYARLEGLRKLVERYREEARLLADKQEQKQLDEFAQRLRPPVY